MKAIEISAHLMGYFACFLKDSTNGKHMIPMIASKFSWKNLLSTGIASSIASPINRKGWYFFKNLSMV